MQRDGSQREPGRESSDPVLWRKSLSTVCVADEAERFLDLAGYADGMLDPDERDRVAEWLVGDPEAAGDIAAAHLASAAELSESGIARACALVPPAAGSVVPFRRARALLRLGGAAGWGSLVAAMVVAGWLGFTLGVDTTLSIRSNQGSDQGFVRELLDPPSSFLRDSSEGPQT